MPGFQSKYSDDQRKTLLHAVIDEERTVRSVLDSAKAGELGGLTPEEARELGTIPYTYACQLVKRERGERAMVALDLTDIDPTVRRMAARMIAVAEYELRKLERRVGHKPADIDRMSRLAKLLREVRALAREETKAAGNAPSKPRGETSSFAAQLAEASRSNGAQNTQTTEDPND